MFQAGGLLTLMMTFILILKARYALTQNYKRTEMWIMLPKEFRPPERYAQWAASTVLAGRLLHFRAIHRDHIDHDVADRPLLRDYRS